MAIVLLFTIVVLAATIVDIKYNIDYIHEEWSGADYIQHLFKLTNSTTLSSTESPFHIPQSSDLVDPSVVGIIRGNPHSMHVLVPGGYFIVAEEVDHHELTISSKMLRAAFIFLFCTTLWQYAFQRTRSGKMVRAEIGDTGFALVIVNLAFIVSAIIFAWSESEWFFRVWSGPFQYLVGWKEVWLLAIAILFAIADYQLKFKSAEYAQTFYSDVAIIFSLLASIVTIGFLVHSEVTEYFTHAYTAGVLVFHMVLGVVLFGLSLIGQPETKQP